MLIREQRIKRRVALHIKWRREKYTIYNKLSKVEAVVLFAMNCYLSSSVPVLFMILLVYVLVISELFYLVLVVIYLICTWSALERRGRPADPSAALDHVRQSSAPVPGQRWAPLQRGSGCYHAPAAKGRTRRRHVVLWHLYLPVVSWPTPYIVACFWFNKKKIT